MAIEGGVEGDFSVADDGGTDQDFYDQVMGNLDKIEEEGVEDVESEESYVEDDERIEEETQYVTREDMQGYFQNLQQNQDLVLNRYLPLIEQRLAALSPEEEVAESPDPEQRPVDAMMHQIGEVASRIDSLKEDFDSSRTEAAGERYTQGVSEYINQSNALVEDPESDFHIPDFNDARNYIVQRISRSLRSSNPGATELELVGEFRDYFLEIVEDVRQAQVDSPNAGINFGHYLYEWALEEGYVPVEHESEEESEEEFEESEDSRVAIFEEEKARRRGSNTGARLPRRSRRSVPEDQMNRELVEQMSESDWAEHYKDASIDEIFKDMQRIQAS